MNNNYRAHGVYVKEVDIDILSSMDNDFERRRKLNKIVDKINDVEHKYIETQHEYIFRKLNETSGIPLKYFSKI